MVEPVACVDCGHPWDEHDRRGCHHHDDVLTDPNEPDFVIEWGGSWYCSEHGRFCQRPIGPHRANRLRYCPCTEPPR